MPIITRFYKGQEEITDEITFRTEGRATGPQTIKHRGEVIGLTEFAEIYLLPRLIAAGYRAEVIETEEPLERVGGK